MRDYGIVSPQFWVGESGKKLRGHRDEQIVALYLITSPHANMTGVYHLPRLYIAHETGLPLKGASKALQSLIEAGFCEYDEPKETVFVIRMAAIQLAKELQPLDKRVPWLKKEVEKMNSAALKQRFLQTCGQAFHLVPENWQGGPIDEASEPHRSLDQDQGQDIDQDQDQDRERERDQRPDRPHPLPVEFELTQDRKGVADAQGLDPQRTFEKFCAHCRANGVLKIDWDAAWQKWCLDEPDRYAGKGTQKPPRVAKTTQEMEAEEREREAAAPALPVAASAPAVVVPVETRSERELADAKAAEATALDNIRQRTRPRHSPAEAAGK